MWTYEVSVGLWSEKKEAFYALCMSLAPHLGKYGTMRARMETLYKLAGAYNQVGPEWTQRLNALAPGLVPFANGLFHIATEQLRAFRPEDLLTVKFGFDAPTAAELAHAANTNALQVVRQCMVELFPEAALRSEVMKRLASSFFRGKPQEGKYFLQLYGEGNNGKTTLFQMLRTAFPAWVQMPEVEHLLMHGRRSDANAPQPWKMDVMGARLVLLEEPPADGAFDAKLLCKLRGGGVVTGRNLYAQNVSYLPTYRIVIGANSPIEMQPTDRAVLNSIHVYAMPSTFVDAGDPRLGPPAQGLFYAKVADLHARFAQRDYRLALFHVLREYYDEYEGDGLDSQQTPHDLRSIYQEEHGRTDQEFFDACFVVVDQDGGERLTTGAIHDALKDQGYAKSKKALGAWLKSRFHEHASVRVVHHSGVLKWVCIEPAPDDGA